MRAEASAGNRAVAVREIPEKLTYRKVTDLRKEGDR